MHGAHFGDICFWGDLNASVKANLRCVCCKMIQDSIKIQYIQGKIMIMKKFTYVLQVQILKNKLDIDVYVRIIVTV